MDLRRRLLAHTWAQLLLVFAVASEVQPEVQDRVAKKGLTETGSWAVADTEDDGVGKATREER